MKIISQASMLSQIFSAELTYPCDSLTRKHPCIPAVSSYHPTTDKSLLLIKSYTSMLPSGLSRLRCHPYHWLIYKHPWFFHVWVASWTIPATDNIAWITAVPKCVNTAEPSLLLIISLAFLFFQHVRSVLCHPCNWLDNMHPYYSWMWM